MILCIDAALELEAGLTGLNTRAGDAMTVTFIYMFSTTSRLADRTQMVLHSDHIFIFRKKRNISNSF